MTAPTDSNELVFRPMEATEQDLELFHRCFAANGSPRSLDLLRWQYFQPPAGKLLVDLAETTDGDRRLAAIYAVFPVWMRANGRRVIGVQSLNTLTDEAFRGRGLFLRMATALYERAQAEGVELVYGFPNGNSAHGFFKRLSWDTLDPVPLIVRPLRSGYILRKFKAGPLSRLFDIPLGSVGAPKLAPGYSLRTIDTPTESFDAVWDRFAANIAFGVERTADYIKWRLGRPGEQYEIVGLFHNEALVGFSIIASTVTEEKEQVGKLLDMIFDPAHEEAARYLVAESLHRLKTRGCTVVWAWNFEHSPGHAAYRSAGFIQLPEKLHAMEGHAGVRAFTPMPGVGDRAGWYMSMLDYDAE